MQNRFVRRGLIDEEDRESGGVSASQEMVVTPLSRAFFIAAPSICACGRHGDSVILSSAD